MPVDPVEGIAEIQFQQCLPRLKAAATAPTANGMHGAFHAQGHGNTGLQGPEVGSCVGAYCSTKALGRQPPKDLAHSNGPHPSVGLQQSDKTCASEVWRYVGGRSTGSKPVHKRCKPVPKRLFLTRHKCVKQVLCSKA